MRAKENVPTRDLRLIFDTMSIMRSLKAKETYEKWFDQIMKVRMLCQAEIL